MPWRDAPGDDGGLFPILDGGIIRETGEAIRSVLGTGSKVGKIGKATDVLGGSGGGGPLQWGVSLVLPRSALATLDAAGEMAERARWLTNPVNWARVVALCLGLFLLLLGLVALVKAGNDGG
ncbi:MAG: hypothetical protein PHN44_09700 [Candidatus Marinimicrobia bacterium]|nr:hypothetical protein [Candidatus Neomarinimicrobiota bacterium]